MDCSGCEMEIVARDAASGRSNCDQSGENKMEKQAFKNLFIINLTTIFYVVGYKTVDPLAYQYVYYRNLRMNLPNITDMDVSRDPCINATGSNDTDERNLAQSMASQWIMYCHLTSLIPAVFVSVIYGSLSDSYGRRPLFIASILGILGKASVLCCVVNFELSLYWLFVGFSVEGFGGSFAVFLVSLYSSIADIIPVHRNRTFYFALANISISFASLCGSLSLGVLIIKLGYFYPSILCIGASIVAISIACFGIDETFIGNKRIETFSKFISKAFRFYFVKDEKSNRFAYAILVATMFWSIFPITSRTTVETLYLENHPFCFSSFKISLFQASFAVREMISVIGILSMQKCCSNETMTLISLVSNISGLLMEAFVRDSWEMYLVPALSMFGTMFISTIRGIMSNLTSQEDQGSLFAGLLAVETISSLVSGTVANVVYQRTLGVFSGSVFLFYAGTQSVATFLIVCYMSRENRIGQTRKWKLKDANRETQVPEKFVKMETSAARY